MQRSTLYNIAYWVGCGVLLSAMAVGSAYSWKRDQQLPGIAFDNLVEIEGLLETEDYDRAIQQLEMTLDFVPSNRHLTHNLLGNALEAQERFDEAEAHFLEAIGLEPDYAEPHNNLGVIYAKRGNMQEAAERFEAALALKPEFAEAQQNLARAQARLGEAATSDDQAPADPPPPPASTDPLKRARHLAQLFYDDQIEALHREFDAAFGAQMPVASLAEVRKNVREQLGKETAIENEDIQQPQEGFFVYTRTSRYANFPGPVNLMIGLGPDRSVAGFMIRPASPDTPLP